jgi:hypothetical protein
MTNVYRGQPALVHIRDGERAAVGKRLSNDLNERVRDNAGAWDDRPLCPGCYMVAILNCAIETARANGQSLSELGNSLGEAFLKLARDSSPDAIEAIEVVLDAEPCAVPWEQSWLDAHERAS